MKKLVLLSFILAPFFAIGQIELEVFNTMTVSHSYHIHFPEKSHISIGGGFGISGQTFNENVRWVSAVQLSTVRRQRNFVSHSDHSLNIDNRITKTFLEMPVGFRFFIVGNKWRLFLQPITGPSFYLGSIKNIRIERHNQSDKIDREFFQEEVPRTGFYGAFAAGLEIPISSTSKLLVMPMASINLLSLEKKTTIDNRFQSFGLRTGVAF